MKEVIHNEEMLHSKTVIQIYIRLLYILFKFIGLKFASWDIKIPYTSRIKKLKLAAYIENGTLECNKKIFGQILSKNYALYIKGF